MCGRVLNVQTSNGVHPPLITERSSRPCFDAVSRAPSCLPFFVSSPLLSACVLARCLIASRPCSTRRHLQLLLLFFTAEDAGQSALKPPICISYFCHLLIPFQFVLDSRYRSNASFTVSCAFVGNVQRPRWSVKPSGHQDDMTSPGPQGCALSRVLRQSINLRLYVSFSDPKVAPAHQRNS